MNNQVTIRAETPADGAMIREVNTLAFGRDSEARIVEVLRESPGFIPELSLVAEANGVIVGHALFSPVRVEAEDKTTELIALGPIAVRPEWQRQGIGGQLIRAGIDRATAQQHRAIILIGHPTYYPRFGFTPASAYGLKLPFSVPDDVFMVLPLRADGLAGITGTVIYPPAFFEGS